MPNYPFLVLCVLMVVPVFAAGVLRRDLVIHMARMALISLPFAFTEFMFYPDYWDPPFLFDAAEKFGFGLEDVGDGAFDGEAVGFGDFDGVGDDGAFGIIGWVSACGDEEGHGDEGEEVFVFHVGLYGVVVRYYWIV